MKIKTKDLQEALTAVKAGLANKEIIEQTTSFCFLNGVVCTYNDEISVRCPISGLNVTGAVSADLLYKVVQKIKGDEIDITVTDMELLLTSGKASSGLILDAEIKLPFSEVPTPEQWHDISPEFTETLKMAMQACSSDMLRPSMTGVHITPEYMESTDGYRCIRVDMLTPFTNTIIPMVVCRQVIGMTPTHVSITDGWVHFKNTAGVVLSGRIIQGTFPNTSGILAQTYEDGVSIVFPIALKDIIDRAEVVGKKQHEMDSSIYVKIENKEITVESKSVEGWYKEVANIKYTGSPVEFIITPSLLKIVLDKLPQSVISDKCSQIRFTGEGWVYLAMLKLKITK